MTFPPALNQHIAPLSSSLWLSKLNELVDILHNLAVLIEDELPRSIQATTWATVESHLNLS